MDKKYGIGIGNFDGVHLGHRFLIDTLVCKAREEKVTPMVYTFKNHPQNVLFPDNGVKLIMSPAKKEEMIKQAGAQNVCLDEFDEKLAALSPEEFVEKIIKEKFNAKFVVVGENFTFGAKGIGTAETLKKLGEKHGFKVFVVPTYKMDGNVVSSTLLRKLISEGRVQDYAKYAGHLYTIPGNVCHGREVGRTLGFPTANIEQDKAYVLPLAGVYETRTKIGDKTYAGVTNVGSNPTFNLNHVVVETHILDYDRDIYGKFIEVAFVRRIRGEVKFESIDALKMQIEKDKQNVTELVI